MSEEKPKYTWGDGPPRTDISPQTDLPPLTNEDAKNFLSEALKEMLDRETKYDQPSGERSMSTTVALFATLTGKEITETEGWKFMALLKLVRAQYNGYRKDDYVDLSAYAALAGESASKEGSE